MQNLSPDLIRHIFSNLSKEMHYILRETCKEFKDNINFVKLRIPRMDIQINNAYNIPMLENRKPKNARFNQLEPLVNRYPNPNPNTNTNSGYGIHPIFFCRSQSSKSRLFNSWITYLECANQNCTSRLNALDITNFYYPKSLPPPSSIFTTENKGVRDYTPDYHRIVACEQGVIITRKIPYCRECMSEFVNFGELDNKSKQVPHGPPIDYDTINPYKERIIYF